MRKHTTHEEARFKLLYHEKHICTKINYFHKLFGITKAYISGLDNVLEKCRPNKLRLRLGASTVVQWIKLLPGGLPTSPIRVSGGTLATPLLIPLPANARGKEQMMAQAPGFQPPKIWMQLLPSAMPSPTPSVAAI